MFGGWRISAVRTLFLGRDLGDCCYAQVLHEGQPGSQLLPLDDGAWQGVASFCGTSFLWLWLEAKL